jgi:hypothetical protein
LREFLEGDEEIRKFFKDTFLHGSYATDTAIRPNGDEEFDVDVVLAMDLITKYGKLPNPKDVVDWLVGRIMTSEIYEDKVEGEKRCVRLNYVDGFHLDVLPAHCPREIDEPLLVPDKWEASHPAGYRTWCREVNDKTGGKFTRVVKFLKWWRNLKLGQDCSLSSIVLTTMIGYNMDKEHASDAEALVDVMKAISNSLENQWAVPVIWNPSLPKGTENLARDWKQSDYEEFKIRFKGAKETACKALAEEDREKSIELWKALFGDKFQGAIKQEAQQMKEAVKSGNAVITSAGYISSTKARAANVIEVQPVRQYGG